MAVLTQIRRAPPAGRAPARAGTLSNSLPSAREMGGCRRQRPRLEGNPRRLRRPGGSRRLPEDGALSKRCRSDEGVLCDLDERGDHRHSKPRRQAQGLVRHGERDSGGPHQATRLGGRRVGMVVVRRRQAAQGYVDGVPFRLHECHVAATATGRIYVNGYPVLRH